MSDADTKRDKLLESIADENELDGFGEGSKLYNHVKSGYVSAYTTATNLERKVNEYNSTLQEIVENYGTYELPDGSGAVQDFIAEIPPPAITTGGTFQNKLKEATNTKESAFRNASALERLSLIHI